MTRPYSEDLRERALARSDAGETDRSIAQALSIAPSCLSKWRKLRRETGALKPGKMNGHKKSTLTGPIAAWLRTRLGLAPFTTRQLVGELAARGVKIRPAGGVGVCDGRRAELQKTARPAEPDRPDIARKRRRWKAHQARIAASRLVFLDETWVKTNMAPRARARGPRGRPAAAPAQGPLRPLADARTFIRRAAADHRVEAPLVIDGPINRVRSSPLMSSRRSPPPCDRAISVILDNLGSHKGKAVRRAIRDKGAHLLFLPPYSPDLNPIEQLFAKLKHLMRKAEERAHEATWRRVGQLLDLVCPSECANYLKNAGYASV